MPSCTDRSAGRSPTAVRKDPQQGDVITLEGVDQAERPHGQGVPPHPRDRRQRRAVSWDEDLRGSRGAVRGTQGGRASGRVSAWASGRGLRVHDARHRANRAVPQLRRDTSEFSDSAMSLNFYSDDPVKAVDGNEYRECPQCGEDALELRGKSPVGWGWDIVCVSCGWEIKQAERLDIDQYCDLMEEVKSRVESINQLMEMPGITIRTRVESVSLQLRMLLELIVFSSLGVQQGRVAESPGRNYRVPRT